MGVTGSVADMGVVGGRVLAPALVDVGIPTLGREQFLVGAVESVLGQTLERWRLVIQVDGPRSPALERLLVGYLEDSRIELRSTGERVGAAENMTRLVLAGSAPFVALLHDDDYWDPAFLERRVEFLQRHPDCGYVFGGLRLVDEQGQFIERHQAPLSPGMQPQAGFVGRLVRRNLVPSPSVLVRRSAYTAVGAGFDQRLQRIYDYEMWIRLALHYPVGYLDVTDAAYRIHSGQSRLSLHDRSRDLQLLAAEVEPVVSRLAPEVAPTSREWRRILSDWLLTNALDAISQGDREFARHELWSAIRGHPAAVTDPRVPSAILALALRRPGRHTLDALRTYIRRHRISVHRWR